MNDLLIVFLGYMIISEFLALISAIRLILFYTCKRKKFPILYGDDAKVSLILCATGIWLPFLIIFKIYETYRY